MGTQARYRLSGILRAFVVIGALVTILLALVRGTTAQTNAVIAELQRSGYTCADVLATPPEQREQLRIEHHRSKIEVYLLVRFCEGERRREMQRAQRRLK